MSAITIDAVKKTFGGAVTALREVSLTVRDQEFLVLLGPSGCGKTTLLRIIAGLERATSGRILIGNRDVTNLAPRERRLAMVFQNYAVFPHMTVFDNIAFGLRMRRATKADVDRHVREAAELLHIENLLDRFPAETSGGQRQRIAVARALATQPQVLLMDEPLSNLDALLRLEARAELKRLLNEIGSTTIYVTHDQVEAMSMGDRVAVMRTGKLVQVGDPLTIYDGPIDRFVGGFIGNPPMNFLPATITRDNGTSTATLEGAGEIRIESGGGLNGHTGPVLLGIRAENVEVLPSPTAGTLRARVLVVEPLGSHNLVTLQVGGELLKATTRPDERLERDQEVAVRIDATRIRWLDADREVSLTPTDAAPPDVGHGAVTSDELDAGTTA